MGDTLRFDIAGRDVGGSATLKNYSREADIAATQTRRLADAMDAQRRAAATSAGATLASAKADKIWRDAQDEAIAKTVKQRMEQDGLTKSSIGLKSRIEALTGGGGLSGGGMIGLAVAAGTVLSPVITTLGFGLGGLGLAAAGIAKPIEQAAQKSGGLSKNLHTLDGEQKTVALSLLGLGKNFGTFEQALKPQILGAFNEGIRIAGHLLHDVEPIAAATGKALNQVLMSVDREFQSGTWQQFFTWMARQAGPDVQQLGKVFTDLLQVLPGLLKELQPLASELIKVSDAAVQAAGHVQSFYDSFQKNVPVSNEHTINFLKDLDRWTVELTNHIPGARAVNDWLSGLQFSLTGTGTAAEKAAPQVQHATGAVSDLMKTTVTTVDPVDRLGRATSSASFTIKEYGKNANLTVTPTDRLGRVADVSAASIGHVATAADFANIKVIKVRHSVQDLTTALSKGLDPLLNYSNALLTQKGDAQNLADALKASGNRIGFQTQKQRDSFSAANTYIGDLENTAKTALQSHQGIDKQITSLENALPALEHAQSHSKLYWQEVRTLISYLDKLRAEKRIREAVTVFGSGTWSLSQPGGKLAGPTGTATGWLVSGGSPGKDSVPIMAMPGELVVPTKMVAAGAVDHLRGQIPGFASGGIVPKYSGSVAGLPPWIGHNQSASISAITAGIANAFASSFKAMFSRGAAGAGPARHASMPWLEGLWDAAGGPPGAAHLMAAIAMAESGGNPRAYNPSGASGLWQILGLPFPGNPFDPLTNARMAVSKYESQGLGAWVTYTNGAYRQFYGNGLRGGIFTRPTPIVVGDKQPERVDVTPIGRPGGQGGAMVNIENYHSHHDADPYILSQQISFRIVAAALS